jgi:prepilin-type processing-associated H-X9-DG protein
LAEEVAAKRVFIRVPTMCELEAASGKERCMWRRLMGGSYAYQMGYIEGDRHCAIRNEGSCRKAVLADAPSGKHVNLQSANHGGCGQNVLYQDGHVGYQKKCTPTETAEDHLYLNDEGKEAAGLGRFDTVLGRSEATPGRIIQLDLTP